MAMRLLGVPEVTKTPFVSTGKADPSTNFPIEVVRSDYTYYSLAKLIEKVFPTKQATMYEIFIKVTGSMGLTYEETKEVVRKAVKSGYLKKGKIKK